MNMQKLQIALLFSYYSMWGFSFFFFNQPLSRLKYLLEKLAQLKKK